MNVNVKFANLKYNLKYNCEGGKQKIMLCVLTQKDILKKKTVWYEKKTEQLCEQRNWIGIHAMMTTKRSTVNNLSIQ